jgi:hypothetical protein
MTQEADVNKVCVTGEMFPNLLAYNHWIVKRDCSITVPYTSSVLENIILEIRYIIANNQWNSYWTKRIILLVQ